MGKGGVEGVHPLEASRAMKGVSAHIKVTDGAGVPGARMVTDGARVRMDIATNKEQSQDKDTSKGSPVNGQPSEKTVRDNVGDLLVEPLGRSVLPFRPIPIRSWSRIFVVSVSWLKIGLKTGKFLPN